MKHALSFDKTEASDTYGNIFEVGDEVVYDDPNTKGTGVIQSFDWNNEEKHKNEIKVQTTRGEFNINLLVKIPK